MFPTPAATPGIDPTAVAKGSQLFGEGVAWVVRTFHLDELALVALLIFLVIWSWRSFGERKYKI